ncbi:MAG: hypothetical protein HYU86_06740 [Chloroflexi bacterium]|nr:hypothetical protein [Chloroflexota bacterium]
MPMEVKAIFQLFHVVAAVFMAAPLYALIITGERARFPVPMNFNTDRYLENLLKNQPLRCYVYLGTVLVTGLVLISTDGFDWSALVLNSSLVIKLVAFLLLVGLLSYVHFSIQPQIEKLMGPGNAGAPIPEAVRPRIAALRFRRRRLAAVCLFLVLTAVIMGLRVLSGYSIYLALVFIVLAALFAWRTFKAIVPYGWI